MLRELQKSVLLPISFKIAKLLSGSTGMGLNGEVRISVLFATFAYMFSNRDYILIFQETLSNLGVWSGKQRLYKNIEGQDWIFFAKIDVKLGLS